MSAPDPVVSGAPESPDPAALLLSRQYRVLLVLAALVGLVVSAASWCFLEGVHELQVWVYEDLPEDLGYHAVPVWWPLPWVALAGLLTAFAVVRLPGHGGHVPVEGLKAGGPPTRPIDLPGVLLAALATLGLGLVLGPGGPPDRGRARARDDRDAAGQARRARPGRGPDGGGGELRCGVVDLRLAGDRRRADHRGDGARRADPAARAPARTPGCRSRLARLHRARVVLGLQHRRLVVEPVPAAAVRRPGLGRLRLDDPARRRHCPRGVRDHGARPLGEASRRSAPVPAHDRGRARGRRPRDRLRRSDRQLARRRALLGRGGVRLALRAGGDRLALDPCAAAPLQGPRVVDLAGKLPWRPDLPRALPRRRRRTHGQPPARLRRDTGGRRAHRRRLRLRPPAPTRLRHDRHAALSQSRPRGRPADRRGRGRRLPHERGAHRLRRRPRRRRPLPRANSPPPRPLRVPRRRLGDAGRRWDSGHPGERASRVFSLRTGGGSLGSARPTGADPSNERTEPCGGWSESVDSSSICSSSSLSASAR